MLKKNILILIGVAVVIIAAAAYFMFTKKNDKSTSWRTDPAKVDIVVSENRHTVETLPPANTTAVAADSVAVEQPVDEPTFQPIEINIQASSISDLANKIKGKTEVILSNNPYLSPTSIKLDLQKNSFNCVINQASQKSNFVKLGLYYGPAASGCESCKTVIQKNPGSVVLASGNGNGLVGQVIGIK